MFKRNDLRAILAKGLLLITALLYTPEMYAFRFAVYGDSRAPKGDSTLVNRAILGFINEKVHTLHPEFVFFVGDAMNKAWAQDYVHNNLRDWIHFMRQGLKEIPFYVAPGNTEFYGNTNWTEFPLQTEYQNTFTFFPNNGPKHYKKLAYSIEHGKGQEKSLFMVLDAFGFYEVNSALTNFDNGFDTEQIQWFQKTAEKSSAHNKFVITHGPAFSVEGFPVKDSVKEIWKLMGKNKFDIYYCGHEHIFSRWLITKSIFPETTRRMTQTIVGSAGATPDNESKVVVDKAQAHIYSGYTFVIVDVHPHSIHQKTYAVIPQIPSGYTTEIVDEFTIRK